MLNVRQTNAFSSWLRSLRDQRARQKIVVRLQRMKFGHFGDVEAVGQGVSELRIHEGKGYRVYFRQQGSEVILLLCGGDKKSQQKDIAIAHQMAREISDET
ncbi:MAG: type II toxin-antitoxin system RelE/ParE family toxin [Roseicyclus sp.]|jgi:putative addiction module killer protein|uniref:type II toxin-antitoxin system RelE/ParE family toxin n=1 Tax=Roseicyclus sp. TaxID=1914329 RepID=UPI003BB0FF92